MTEPPTLPPLPPRRSRVPAPVWGLVCAAAGVTLLALPNLVAAALGVECIALAFWLWSRLGADRREQLARWAWLRRPALALWLAAALSLALPAPHADAPQQRPGLGTVLMTPEFAAAPERETRDPLGVPRALRALAVLWAGLELLGALPLSRPYPDVPGPLPAAGPWLPAMLPAAGFLVLWRQSAVWTDAPLVRELAALALLLAAALAVLRAYTRHSWTASLRWLAVFDSALAAMLVALEVVPREVTFLLWFAAAGGRMVALAVELHGAAGRRGPRLARAWRVAGWTAGTSLAWPLLSTVGFSGGRFRPVEYVLLGMPIFLAAALSLRRVVAAPERRAVSRPDAARLLSFAGAVMTIALGPLALALAWWSGFEVSLPAAVAALLPGAMGAWPRAPRPVAGADESLPPVLRAPAAVGAREFALAVFRAVTSFERRLAEALGALLLALGSPARDLHTGDAQEYLLFLVGISVLALLLPLLRP